MVPIQQVFLRLRYDLDELLRQRDIDRLRDMLSGADMPAVGNDYESAELILRALETPRFDYKQAQGLARLAAPLVDAQTQALKNSLAQTVQAAISSAGSTTRGNSQQTYWANPTYLYNLFLLASGLPAETSLFDALHGFFTAGHQATGLADRRAALQLRRALCNQQKDQRLQDYWLGQLSDKTANWDSDRRTELMDAWRGLLWSTDINQPDNFQVLDKALLQLHDTVEDRPEGIALLRHALNRLEQAFPSSVGSGGLIARIRPYWNSWPGLLKDTALVLWPGLEPKPLAAIPHLPPELNQVWQALSEQKQEALLKYLSTGDAVGGRKFIQQDLFFDTPQVAGIALQEIRNRLLDLAQRLWPKDKTKHEIEAEPDLIEQKKASAKPERKQAVDRLAFLESVDRTLKAVEQRLTRGDEDKARRFLDELIEQQRQQQLPDMPKHLAKTLSHAATIVRNYGDNDWAEALLRQAIQENANDPIAASGLADVLKIQGDLAAAERQYRDNMARWPNNEVAASGLADVLKIQGDLAAAERQYRDNMARWPNNEVAASGLADVLKIQGDLAAAERQYRDNMARWPNNEVAASGLADVLKIQGDLAAAERQYRDNMARWPNDEVAASGLADVLKIQGDLAAAERQYRDNMARWPNDEVAASGLADVLKIQGDLAAAERQYRDNMARWPNGEVAASGLADVLKIQGDLAAAERQYRDNMARWPNDEVAANGLADVLKIQGDLAAAERQYRDNMARWPNDRVSRNGLASVLRRQGRVVEALNAVFSPSVVQTESDLYDLHLRAILLLDLGRVDEAQAALKRGRAEAKLPVQHNIFDSSLIMLALKVQNYTDARTRLERMPSNVVSLQLYRLHAVAGMGDAVEAHRIKQSLHTYMPRPEHKQVLERIEQGFCLLGEQGLCQPDEAALNAIYDAEVEMELAA